MLSYLFALALVPGFDAPPHPLFEPPVRIAAGDKFMGENMLYPSPVFFDLDGDQKPEIVLGDLFGKLTACQSDGKSWKPSQPIRGADGKSLEFNNW